MAVQLSDVYRPLTFNRRAQVAQTKLNNFVSSGIAVADPLISQRLATTNIADIPQFSALATGEPNYSNDVPGDTATPEKIGSVLGKVRSASRNNHWSAMDLARELTDADPMEAITNRVGAYWACDDESRIIQSLNGILADNIANDNNDMVETIATDANSTVTDAERISAEAVNTAVQTAGDHKNMLTGIAMHSVQHTRLANQDLVKDYRDTRDGSIMFQTYLGMRVVIDDSLPVVQGSHRITYTVVIFGDGAISFGNGMVETPSELTREALAGNGGGQSIISSRVNNAFHPNGFSFLSSSVAGQSATYAELANAANWDRVVPRKSVPIAFLRVND